MNSASTLAVASLASLFAGSFFVADRVQRPPAGRAPVLRIPVDEVRESTGPITVVDLDAGVYLGAAKERSELTWRVEGDDSVSITSASSSGARLEFDMRDACEVKCTLVLVARNAFGTTRGTTSIVVRDTTPPVLVCPPDAEINGDAPIDPGATGMAAASDNRVQNVRLSYVDHQLNDDFVIRTWRADDGCQSSTGIQTLMLNPLAPPAAHLDIKPGKCPNKLKIKIHGDDGDDDDGDDDDGDDDDGDGDDDDGDDDDGDDDDGDGDDGDGDDDDGDDDDGDGDDDDGDNDDGDDDDGDDDDDGGHDLGGTAGSSVTVGLLGNHFDVTLVDLASVRFVRVFDNLTSRAFPTVIFPTDFSFSDLNTPFEGPMCGCHVGGLDKLLDLRMLFSEQEVIDAFGLADEPDGAMIALEIRGRFVGDIRPFRARDCVQIVIQKDD